MNEATDIEAVSAEALRKLGRNILNFSKIEAGLKLLLSVSHVEGTTTTIHENIKARQRELRKKLLGTLVTKFTKSILSNVEEPKPPERLNKPWLSLSFNLMSTYSDEWKQTLITLVRERNRLIHQDLAHIDVTSIDEQNPRLLDQLDNLRWMLCSLSETVQSIRLSPELHQLIASSNESV